MKSVSILAQRSEFLRAMREFFYAAGFIEVETPVKIHAPAPEEYIESVQSEGDFLRTSPELAMKVLLSQGCEKIFQIGSCFRANEHGRKHLEEFTMLEFYAVKWDYRQLAEFTAAMLKSAAGNNPVFSSHDFITVDEAFRRYAGVSAFEADADDTFDELMVTKVEPNLGTEELTFLMDYPASRASLSRLSAANPKVAERWELYRNGLELANAFGELTDSVEQRKRFEAANKFRAANNMHAYPEPVEFYAALDKGLPESSGCAIGVDRLLMLLCNENDIRNVRA
ncbi:MAG: EF-P lysine aminoacylase GenX [Lentisphaeria bacterium]|nr:EF-P lysine aminoacylase GenX [Lentisphaeria bacterium]